MEAKDDKLQLPTENGRIDSSSSERGEIDSCSSECEITLQPFELVQTGVDESGLLGEDEIEPSDGISGDSSVFRARISTPLDELVDPICTLESDDSGSVSSEREHSYVSSSERDSYSGLSEREHSYFGSSESEPSYFGSSESEYSYSGLSEREHSYFGSSESEQSDLGSSENRGRMPSDFFQTRVVETVEENDIVFNAGNGETEFFHSLSERQEIYSFSTNRRNYYMIYSQMVECLEISVGRGNASGEYLESEDDESDLPSIIDYNDEDESEHTESPPSAEVIEEQLPEELDIQDDNDTGTPLDIDVIDATDEFSGEVLQPMDFMQCNDNEFDLSRVIEYIDDNETEHNDDGSTLTKTLDERQSEVNKPKIEHIDEGLLSESDLVDKLFKTDYNESVLSNESECVHDCGNDHTYCSRPANLVDINEPESNAPEIELLDEYGNLLTEMEVDESELGTCAILQTAANGLELQLENGSPLTGIELIDGIGNTSAASGSANMEQEKSVLKTGNKRKKDYQHKCECQNSFKTFRGLMQHKRLKHNEFEASNQAVNTKIIPVQLHNHDATEEDALLCRYRRVQGVRPIECFCGFRSKNLDGMMKHKRRSHNLKGTVAKLYNPRI